MGKVGKPRGGSRYVWEFHDPKAVGPLVLPFPRAPRSLGLRNLLHGKFGIAVV